MHARVEAESEAKADGDVDGIDDLEGACDGDGIRCVGGGRKGEQVRERENSIANAK